MTDPKDPTADDREVGRPDEDRERLQRALLERIDAFMDEEGVEGGEMIEILIEVALRLRMAAYGANVEEPAVESFKFDLEGFRHDIEILLREAKKGAEGYVEFVKQTRARQAN
jgi:hypothetical protein